MNHYQINWSAIDVEHVTDGMKRQMFYGEQIMISKMTFTDGFEVPWHEHHNEQVSQVISGQIRFLIGQNEEEILISAGDYLVIPPHVRHSTIMIGEVTAIDIFSPPRQDWIDGTDDYLRKQK